jgi:inner membrane protein
MEQEEGYLIGYRSVFDKTATDFQFVKRNGELLSHIREREDVQNLIQFSNNYYVVSQPDSNLVFSDLRFGQQFGWVDRMAPFVFNYDLKYPDNNKAVIQRGRLGGWTSRNIKLTLRRIGGR